MTKSLLVLFLVFFFALPVFAQQVDTAWARRYNGPLNSHDKASALVVDNSGSVYVTGGSYNYKGGAAQDLPKQLITGYLCNSTQMVLSGNRTG